LEPLEGVCAVANEPDLGSRSAAASDLGAPTEAIRPGCPWLDTEGKRIQAHGGSVISHDGAFYWYGENKERTTPGGDIWHWGVRCYRSTDLCNWQDLGLIVRPDPDDPDSPLHPSQMVDRPHIVRSRKTGLFVCWLKIMQSDGSQRSTVLTAPDLLGPYSIVRTDLRPLGMNAGDFDLVVDPHDGKAYYYFERVHSELVCADLTEDCTNVTGYYSTHFPRGCPPYVREAPAYFFRNGKHYLITSGTTGYHPNPSEIAVADTYHGPWRVLGNPHPYDASLSSFNSQITSVFRHPAKRDLYIALGDRWLPGLPAAAGPEFDTGGQVRSALAYTARLADPDGVYGPRPAEDVAIAPAAFDVLKAANTSIADYVWLPISFDGEMPVIEWRDEWHPDEFQ
jgi:hypothetical protein